MDVDAYLRRIRYEGPRQPSLETLAGLQRAHMLAVPFENLDIHLGRTLVLDRQRNFEKVVSDHRGGWCFELNGLFAWLLERLGFDVKLLGGRVIGEQESEPDVHLLLRVELDATWVADVGFGESSLEPIPLADVASGRIRNGDLEVVFENRPRCLEEFAPACRRLQTSPDSHFTRERVCTLALPDGRVTLSEMRLIETHDGERQERELSGEEEWRQVLAERFGVLL